MLLKLKKLINNKKYIKVYYPITLLDCDDPAGRHLGRRGPTDPPQKEQCRRKAHTVLRTGPGVQRPEAPTSSQKLLGGPQGPTTPNAVQFTAWQ